MIKTINTFDIDGVITVGLYPGPNDVIITGRSFEEAPETYAMLRNKGINNPVYFNPLPWDKKDRPSSGVHKGLIIKRLIESGVKVGAHFEDDEVQKEQIEKVLQTSFGDTHGGVVVVHIVHDMTEKENVRHAMPGTDLDEAQEPFDMTTTAAPMLSEHVKRVFNRMNEIAKGS